MFTVEAEFTNFNSYWHSNTDLSQNHLSHSCRKIIFHIHITKSSFTPLSQNHLSHTCHKIIFHTSVTKSSFTFLSQNHLSHSCHKIIFHTPVTKSHFTFLSQNHFYSCNYLLSKWNHFSRRHSGKIKFFIITHPDFSSSSGISE